MNKILNFLLVLFIGSFCWYYITGLWGVRIGIVEGSSMEPTYRNGDRIMLDHYSLFFRDPRKNEVVVLRNPIDHKCDIKRIGFVPGEMVKYNNTNYCLGKDEYFILGDNTTNSMDSTDYGPVNKKNIVGVVK
jgi:signal peptidase I